MSHWRFRNVPFKYQISDWTILSVPLSLQVRSVALGDETPQHGTPAPPVTELMEGSQGFLIRNLPVSAALPSLSRARDYLCYVPLQFEHCYIDLSLSFEKYQKKFSSKTRSTINRKIKKYAEHCGGNIVWKTYKRPDEMREFFRLARMVSKLTYQERLLDAGIPESEEFIRRAESLAAAQCVRAYILFDRERPVSYLYCPARDGVLIYAYLGYDPDYMKMSVGTVLQWLALEQLFNEAHFRYFDFTEGESDHKRLFATHQRRCANVFMVKSNLRNWLLICSHLMMHRFSRCLGAGLSLLGTRATVRRFLRFAR